MSHLPHVSTILAEAFLHYPLMCYAFEGKTEQQRQQGLRHLYHHCTQAAAMYGGAVLGAQGNGSLIWLPGTAFPLGLWREVRSGMAAIPFKLGLKATLRLVNHDAASEGWIAKNAGPKMGYIWCLGVRAGQRGKGYSRLLVDESIRQMRAKGLNQFWLKTEDPVNVEIYSRQGFAIANEMVVPSSGIKSWMMKKSD